MTFPLFLLFFLSFISGENEFCCHFIDYLFFMYTIQFSLSIKSLLGLDFMNEKWNIKKPQISSSVSGNYSVRERDQSYQDARLSILKHEALIIAHKSTGQLGSSGLNWAAQPSTLTS